MAFYIALCHEACGEIEQARKWKQIASTHGIPELHGDNADFFSSLDSALVGEPKAAEYFFVSLVAEDDHELKLRDAIRRLNAAREQSDQTKPHTQVRLATWLLLVGELTSRWEELCLSSNSAEAFAQGKQLLDSIEASLDSSPELARLLEEDPELALRFDAALVRRQVIDQREQAVHSRERARLNQLRQIARSYRTAVESMGNAELDLLLGRTAQLRDNQQRLLHELGTIESEVRGRKDFYLFSDEPQLLTDSDYSVLKIEPLPFTANLISFHKSLYAFSILQAAETSGGQRQELLALARQWARTALQEEPPVQGLPAGFDPQNALASYVDVAAADAIAQQVAAKGEVEVGSQFALVRDAAAKLNEQLGSKEPSDTKSIGALQVLAKGLHERLENETSVLRIANNRLQSGELNAARIELSQGALRHHSERLALAYVRLGTIAGSTPAQSRAELNSWRDLRILSPDSPAVVLQNASLVLADIGDQIARRGVPLPPGGENQAILELLSKEEQQLRTALNKQAEQPMRAQLESQLALTLAFGLAIRGKETVTSGIIQESLRLARDSSEVLMSSLAKNESPPFEKAECRDGLIAARMALGYAAITGLPNYRDEGLLAFTAAIDAAVQQHNSAHSIALIGSPLLRALAGRDTNANLQLVAEERGRRQLMTRFVEAAYTSQFGQPQAAAKQTEVALTQYRSSGAVGGAVQAEAIMRDSDGFEAETALAENIRAFQVFAEIKAGMIAQALEHSLEFIFEKRTGGGRLDSELASANVADLITRVERLQSPLSAAALGLAAESAAAAIPLNRSEQDNERSRLLTLARSSTERAMSLLASPRLSERYPHLIVLLEAGRRRLTSADDYVAEVDRLSTQSLLSEAIAKCEEGLQRHPTVSALWRQFINSRVEHLRLTQATAAQLRDLLSIIEVAGKNKQLELFDRAFAEGVIYEQLGDAKTALRRYEESIAAATSPVQRVRATARASALRARGALVAAR